jgi:hypothetical protein
MRQLQAGAKTTFEQAIPPNSLEMVALVRHGCFVSTTDLFGVTVFARIAHIMDKLGTVLNELCRACVCVKHDAENRTIARNACPSLLTLNPPTPGFTPSSTP